MSENPERLWAFFVRGAVYAGTSRASVAASTECGWGASPVTEYVRADLLSAATGRAEKAEARLEALRQSILTIDRDRHAKLIDPWSVASAAVLSDLAAKGGES